MAATLVSAALTRAPTAARRRATPADRPRPRRVVRLAPCPARSSRVRDTGPRSRPTRLLGRDRFVRVGPRARRRHRAVPRHVPTGEKMGSGLSAPDAGVQIMLIDKDGRAFMHGWTATPTSAATTARSPSAARPSAPVSLYSYPRFGAAARTSARSTRPTSASRWPSGSRRTGRGLVPGGGGGAFGNGGRARARVPRAAPGSSVARHPPPSRAARTCAMPSSCGRRRS